MLGGIEIGGRGWCGERADGNNQLRVRGGRTGTEATAWRSGVGKSVTQPERLYVLGNTADAQERWRPAGESSRERKECNR